MQGITFGEYHSYTDFNLMIAAEGIQDIPPSVQENYLDVPYRNTLLDMTESFGKRAYKKRTPSYTFVVIQGGESWDVIIRKISNAIHGKRMKIVYDRDPDYYLLGRVSVNSFKSDKGIGTIVIDAVCDPFKYKRDITTKLFNINGTSTITLANEGQTVYPVVTTTAAMTVVKGEDSFSFKTVTDYQSTIQLDQGTNTLKVTGTGSIVFEYQEGVL